MHPLVRKELREHRGVLIAMWVLCALALLVQLVVAKRGGSPLEAWRGLLQVFGPLLSLAIANRFVVREYTGRTQLFLETLPMGRAQVITIKWLTGAACLILPMALCLALIVLKAAGTVDLTSRFVTLLVLRGLLFLLFVYALAFVIGLTGRYRYVLWMVMALVAFFADYTGQVPFLQWPVTQLISRALPYERQVFPVWDLWITGIATALLIAATFGLALASQGSLVVALSRRMSLREKIVTTASFIAVFYLVWLVEDRKPKPPFSLKDAFASRGDLPKVVVGRAEGVTADAATALAEKIAAELQQTKDYLALEELPVVAVLPDISVDSDLFLVADLPKSDGVVVRGAFGSERFDEAGFRAFTLSHVLGWHSRGRAEREERRWLLDGFTRWRVAGDDAAQRDLLKLRAAIALQSLDASGVTLAGGFRDWLSTREQLGDCLGDALAWRATSLLAETLGAQRFQQLTRTALGTRPSSDVRAFVAEKPIEELLQQAGAPALDALAGRLREVVRSESATMDDAIRAIALPAVKFKAVAMSGSVFELRFEVAAQPAEPLPFAVRYTRLGPWQGELVRAAMNRFDATASGVLPASFPRGERVFTAVEMYSPQLACTLRLGARRWEVR